MPDHLPPESPPESEPAPKWYQTRCARCMRRVWFPFKPRHEKVCDRCYLPRPPVESIRSPGDRQDALEGVGPHHDKSVRCLEGEES